MDYWRCIAVCVGQALLYQQFGDLFAVARRFRAFAEHQAFGHSQTAEAASFQRALFTPGADEFLGPPHALAAQMRLHASRRVPPKPYAQTRVGTSKVKFFTRSGAAGGVERALKETCRVEDSIFARRLKLLNYLPSFTANFAPTRKKKVAEGRLGARTPTRYRQPHGHRADAKR